MSVTQPDSERSSSSSSSSSGIDSQGTHRLRTRPSGSLPEAATAASEISLAVALTAASAPACREALRCCSNIVRCSNHNSTTAQQHNSVVSGAQRKRRTKGSRP